jgi:hypothetical protein
MSRFNHDPIIDFGPRLDQRIRRDDRANHVISSLDNDTWQVAQLVDVIQNLGIADEHIVDEEMGFDTGQG